MADFTTAVGKVRLHISDLADPPMIADAVLEGYLGLHSWDPAEPSVFTDQMLWRASADALDAMATSEVLVSKKIRSQDISVDGPAVAADLRKKAIELRGKANDADADEDSFFEIIPFGGANHPEGSEWRL